MEQQKQSEQSTQSNRRKQSKPREPRTPSKRSKQSKRSRQIKQTKQSEQNKQSKQSTQSKRRKQRKHRNQIRQCKQSQQSKQRGAKEKLASQAKHAMPAKHGNLIMCEWSRVSLLGFRWDNGVFGLGFLLRINVSSSYYDYYSWQYLFGYYCCILFLVVWSVLRSWHIELYFRYASLIRSQSLLGNYVLRVFACFVLATCILRDGFGWAMGLSKLIVLWQHVNVIANMELECLLPCRFVSACALKDWILPFRCMAKCARTNHNTDAAISKPLWWLTPDSVFDLCWQRMSFATAAAKNNVGSIVENGNYIDSNFARLRLPVGSCDLYLLSLHLTYIVEVFCYCSWQYLLHSKGVTLPLTPCDNLQGEHNCIRLPLRKSHTNCCNWQYTLGGSIGTLNPKQQQFNEANRVVSRIMLRKHIIKVHRNFQIKNKKRQQR